MQKQERANRGHTLSPPGTSPTTNSGQRGGWSSLDRARLKPSSGSPAGSIDFDKPHLLIPQNGFEVSPTQDVSPEEEEEEQDGPQTEPVPRAQRPYSPSSPLEVARRLGASSQWGRIDKGRLRLTPSPQGDSPKSGVSPDAKSQPETGRVSSSYAFGCDVHSEPLPPRRSFDKMQPNWSRVGGSLDRARSRGGPPSPLHPVEEGARSLPTRRDMQHVVTYVEPALHSAACQGSLLAAHIVAQRAESWALKVVVAAGDSGLGREVERRVVAELRSKLERTLEEVNVASSVEEKSLKHTIQIAAKTSDIVVLGLDHHIIKFIGGASAAELPGTLVLVPCRAPPPSKIGRVLVCVNSSALTPSFVTECMTLFADMRVDDVVLLNIIKEEQHEAESKKLLRMCRGLAVALAHPCALIEERATRSRTIVEKSPEFHLIAMGCEGRKGMSRKLGGSIIDHVAKHVGVPLWIVHLKT